MILERCEDLCGSVRATNTPICFLRLQRPRANADDQRVVAADLYGVIERVADQIARTLAGPCRQSSSARLFVGEVSRIVHSSSGRSERCIS